MGRPCKVRKIEEPSHEDEVESVRSAVIETKGRNLCYEETLSAVTQISKQKLEQIIVAMVKTQ